MDIEKRLLVEAAPERLWALLLDPRVMGACVPGMQSIDVLSDTEYVSSIHVKLAFVNASFRVKTTIVEQNAPHYLRSESVGEDSSLASSLKQASEIFLTESVGGRTELRMKIHVDVLGRLGTFGLNVMKTKADRMWEEFAQKLAERLSPVVEEAVSVPVQAAPPEQEAGAIKAPQIQIDGAGASIDQVMDRGWWSRLLALFPPRWGLVADHTGKNIHIQVRRADTTVTVDWPVDRAGDCAAWLREYLK